MNATKEYVFQFTRYEFEIVDGEKLLASAREVVANERPRARHAYPHLLESNVDAIDLHVAAWGYERMSAVPGVRLVGRSGRTAAYDLSEDEFEDSHDDPFLWGVDDDDEDDD